MTRRLPARWADDIPPAPDRVDETARELDAELARFRRALRGWVALLAVIAAVWLILRTLHISEAAGAWLGLTGLLVVAVLVIAHGTRRSPR